jgi:hypothetical protein
METNLVVDFQFSNMRTTCGKTITRSDVELFRRLSSYPGNKNEQDVVPESLVMMITIGLMNRTIPLDDYLVAVVSNSWTFLSTVYIDDTVNVSFEVIETKAAKKGNNTIVTYKMSAFNQHSAMVAEGVWKILVRNVLM